MGFIFSKFMKLASGPRPTKLLMIGLDAAGKTTILNQLKIGENLSTIPTIGFNVETLSYKNLGMTIWDLGGQDKIRILWHHYFEGSQGIIYVVDSNDPERISEATEELSKVLSDDAMKGIPLLILANKQDLPGAVSVPKLADQLGILSLVRD